MVNYQKIDRMQLLADTPLYQAILFKDDFYFFLATEIDFTPLEEKIAKSFSQEMGRLGTSVELISRIFIIKHNEDIADRDLIKKCTTDMQMKFFLGLKPEDTGFITHSTLTKLRKNHFISFLDVNACIKFTLDIAKSKGIAFSGNHLIDSTHTNSKFNFKNPWEYIASFIKKINDFLNDFSKETLSNLPNIPVQHNNKIWFDYAKKLVEIIKKDAKLNELMQAKKEYNRLVEILEDGLDALTIEIQNINDAKVGYKNSIAPFYGFKTHIGVDPENLLITGAIATLGNESDYKNAIVLINQIRENGCAINAIVGDKAYWGVDLIEKANNENWLLVSDPEKRYQEHKEHPYFTYNKDSKTYICLAGNSSSSVWQSKTKAGAKLDVYSFKASVCRTCPHKEKCGYVEHHGRPRVYSRFVEANSLYLEHIKKNATKEYKELKALRFLIEQKNADLKSNYGYRISTYQKEIGMNMQAAFSIMTCNLKREFTILSKSNRQKTT
ncbi:MAG: transposase [Mycoplasmataceae bacterium]|jgi:hypothetical protein|nr:transposase [Mycoplasmataceae bacterium]